MLVKTYGDFWWKSYKLTSGREKRVERELSLIQQLLKHASQTFDANSEKTIESKYEIVGKKVYMLKKFTVAEWRECSCHLEPQFIQRRVHTVYCQLWNKWHLNWIIQSGGERCGICTQRLTDRYRERRGSQPLTELHRKDSKWQVRLIDWQGLTEDGIIIHQAKRKAAFLRLKLSEEERWKWKYEYWIIQSRSFRETKKRD